MPDNFQSKVAAATADIDLTATPYQIVLDTTEGTIRLNLDAAKAPNHCLNMIGLAKSGFYDGVVFHRVISGFMIQGGCPQGSGFGGPGYNIDAEFNDTSHEPGTLSMARSSDPNSAGSQFFVCLERVPHLDGEYTAFGQTADAESLAVVKKIGAVPTDGSDRPKTEVKITKATAEAV
ncbi:MAG: peptidylprolyl isomerase [Planctomycetota bacterium]